jgi:hypothetical protein
MNAKFQLVNTTAPTPPHTDLFLQLSLNMEINSTQVAMQSLHTDSHVTL